MNIEKLREAILPGAVDNTLRAIEKTASEGVNTGSAASADVELMVKQAFELGKAHGQIEGYEAGASDGVSTIIEKLAMEDAFENGPTAAAYHQGRMSDHAAETREGLEEIKGNGAINQGDDQITLGADPTPAPTVGGGGGGGPEGGEEKEASAADFLEWLLTKQAEDEGGAMPAGPAGEHDNAISPPGPTSEGDEFGAKTKDLDKDLKRESGLSYSQLVRDMVAGQLDPS